jgi:ATP-dependent protease HslVU (ClpYQ) peptidase subunit
MEKPLSVGIVGVCENGKYAVVACDGTLTYGQQAADIQAPKMLFYAGWTFVFAGLLSSTELFFEEIRQAVMKENDLKPVSRENIQATVREAYNRRVDNWNSLRHLSAYNMTMEQFKASGRKQLGKEVAAELARAMYTDYQQNFTDEIMVIGWGKIPLSVMIYSINPEGDGSHRNDGMYAIGSGRDAAISTLFLLEHKISSALYEAIYAVAAAKFSSEAHGIGKHTQLCVIRKQMPEDADDRASRILIQPDELDKLREIWESKGRPTVPQDALDFTSSIASRTNDREVISRQSLQQFMAKPKATTPPKQ